MAADAHTISNKRKHVCHAQCRSPEKKKLIFAVEFTDRNQTTAL